MTAVKPIHVFKPGKHTAMSGEVAEFTESDLAASAAAYNPALHEAPMVIGHPKADAPSYGVISAVRHTDDGLVAEPEHVDAAFAELVRTKRYSKVSASFYTPTAPNNPVPGVYYLRHVGFLGAQPPAIKGLKPIEFADVEEGVIEFGDWGDRNNASLWRRMRDAWIARFGLEDAEKVLPSYIVDSLTEDALKTDPPGTNHTSMYAEGGDSMTPEQLAAGAAEIQKEKEALEAREATVKAKEAEFAERDAAAAKAAKEHRDAEIVEFADSLVKAGQLRPADKDGLVKVMQSLPDSVTVLEFAEGSTTATPTPALKALQGFLKGLPKQLEFGEHATRSKSAEGLDLDNPTAIANAAQEYQEAEARHGRTVSIELAVQHVTSARG